MLRVRSSPSGSFKRRCALIFTPLLLVTAVVVATASAASTLYVAPGGSGSACTSSAPCGSFDAAYAAAAPGDTVQVAGGSYSGQSITASNKTSGANVVFQPAPGATVKVAGIDVYRSRVTLKDMDLGNEDLTIRKQDVSNPAAVDSVTAQNLTGRNFNIFDATNVTIHGGEWGPASDCGGPYGGCNNSLRRIAGTVPTNITIEDTVIHEVQSYDLVKCHIEGLAIFAGQNVTVRRTKFYGNSIYDVFLQANSGPISNVTFENNWFATPVGTTGSPNGRPWRSPASTPTSPSATTRSTRRSRSTTTGQARPSPTSRSPATSATCPTTAARPRACSSPTTSGRPRPARRATSASAAARTRIATRRRTRASTTT